MSSQSPRRGLTVAALVALVALCFLFWVDCLAGPFTPLAAGFQGEMEPWRSEADLPGTDRQWSPLLWDGVAQFYPWRLLAARALRDGELALWNPHQMCGYPFVGNSQSALFYPPNWLLAFVDVKWGMGLLAAFHYALAAVFTFLLGRTLRLRRLSAAFGAIGFTFGGFIVTWTQLPTLMNSVAWLPAGLLGVALVFRRSPWGVPLLGVALAMTLLAGHAQIAVYVWLVTGLYAAARALWEAVNHRRAHVGRLAAAVVLGAVLAAPQMLPTLELVRNSPRGMAGPSEDGWQFQEERSLRPPGLIALLDPNAFGNPAHGDHLLTAQGIPYSEHCGFVGITTVVLALVGLGFARTRHFAFFVLLSVAALNIAMAGPIARALYWHVPLLGQAGSFSRFLSVFTFALPMAAAFGLDALCGRVSSIEGLRRISLPGGVRPGALLAGLAVLLVGVELLPWAHEFLPRERREHVYPVTPGIERLMAAEGRVLAVTPRGAWRMDRTPAAVLPPNAATVYGYESVSGYDSLMPITFRAFIEQADGAPVAPAVNGNMLLPERALGPGQALMALTTVLAAQRPTADESSHQVTRVSSHGAVAAYEVQPTLPRAFVSPRRSIDVAGPGEIDLTALVRVAGECDWQRIGRGVMEVALPVDRDAESDFLTVSETFYPGWNAYVDGERRDVAPAARVMCGLDVEQGERRVQLVFEPATVRVGCFLAQLGLSLLAALLAGALAVRRRARSHR